MNKQSIIGGCLLLVCVGLLCACSPKVPVVPPVTLDVETTPDLCVDAQTGAEMSYGEAVDIAKQSTCTQEGDLTETRVCNASTGTWWIDLDAEKPGCNPACVVDVNTRTAEVNWRCTGLLTPEAVRPAATETSESATPTATSEAPESPTPTPTLEPRADWARYANEAYGFAFRYPISWTIELLADRPEEENRARAVHLTRDNVHLLIEYKHPDEDVLIGPDTLPEGQIAERGTVTMLGRALPKYGLEQEGQDLVIFVGEQYVDLELYVQMHAGAGEDAEAGIPEAAQTEFDAIIDTFTRIGEAAADPYPGWNTFTRPGTETSPGFTFRYPQDWSPSEIASTEGSVPALNLRSDTLVLSIQARNIDTETALSPEDASAGVVSEAGTASFLGEATRRQVVVQDGRLKLVFVHHLDDAVEIYIALTGDADEVAYADIDLSESARNVMDQILASFMLEAD